MFKLKQSPVTTSPATLSPTSIPTRHPNARFPYSPVNSPGGEGSAFSPTHSMQGASQVRQLTILMQFNRHFYAFFFSRTKAF